MEAIAKMKFRFENKENHPMYGKTHSAETLVKISKGPLNPMYGKNHTAESKDKISLKLTPV